VDAIGVVGSNAAQRVLPSICCRGELDNVEPGREAIGASAHCRTDVRNPEHRHEARGTDPPFDLSAIHRAILARS
jgi:hypothetical protein